MSRKSPSQARARNTVDTILEATARILASRGYAGTNTNLVAEVAGVSVGSLYQYFPNKDALMAALHDRHSQQMHELFRQVIGGSSSRSLRETIAALVRALLDAHCLDAALHAILEREFPIYDTRHEDKTDRDVLRLVQELLQRHVADTTVQNLATAAYIVFETIVSLVHASITEKPPSSPGEIEAEIVAAVMGYLTVPRPLAERLS